jgi:adenosine deaminase
MRDLRRLPKANLHLHLTGAMRPGTFAELAAQYGLRSTVPSRERTVIGWAAFQSRYDGARAAIRTAEDIARVVAEAVADDAADGCGWLELQVDPTGYAPLLGGLEPVLEAVLAAARSAAPAGVGVIVASSWARSPAHALELARLAARYAAYGVVGFGLSNDERAGRVADFAPAFRIAAEAGLIGTPHAGFYEAAWHVRDCVTLLGAHRIGHGLTATVDAATLALLAERSVTLEICPTSYPPLGVAADLSAVPVRALLAHGVPVALGSDDPLLFGAGLADQYAIARDWLGCTDEELAALATHSVTGSAAPAGVKAHLLAGIRDWLAAGAG